MTDLMPPHDIAAEQSCLGSLMVGACDPALVADMRMLLRADDFFQRDHQIIYGAVCQMLDAGTAVDSVTVFHALKNIAQADKVGGAQYLGAIMNSVPSGAHGRHYANIVREHALRRRAIQAGNELIRRCYSGDEPESSIDATIADLARARTNREAQIVHISDVLAEVYEQMEKGGAGLLPSGFASLDNSIGGFGIGEMCILAARPSMGKSTLAKQLAVRATAPVGIISSEEGRTKIGRNILAAEALIENNRLRNPKLLHEQDWKEIAGGIARLAGKPIYIRDRIRRVSDVKAVAAIMASRHGCRLIIVDHLQRLHTPNGRSAYERTTEISAELSDLFKQLDVAGLVVAQLNRGVENRDDKHPSMADLRDSGAIEQDADTILFLHREDFYHMDDERYEPTRVAELCVAKCRDGKRGGVIRLESNLRYLTFADLGEATAFEGT